MQFVEYRCLKCGNHEDFEPKKPSIKCKMCGGRIFVKPRRNFMKFVDAN
ncbi:MAG: DNA-directed RNA polymerase subunit P [Euryarchaeota archaeon]|nr:DNA-directed RNA polymerase subunit P [Euryarchaeota archaeon]